MAVNAPTFASNVFKVVAAMVPPSVIVAASLVVLEPRTVSIFAFVLFNTTTQLHVVDKFDVFEVLESVIVALMVIVIVPKLPATTVGVKSIGALSPFVATEPMVTDEPPLFAVAEIDVIFCVVTPDGGVNVTVCWVPGLPRLVFPKFPQLKDIIININKIF